MDYEYAMYFYDNARQFVFSVLRSVEAQVETSLKYGDDPAVCDEELFPLVMDLSRKTFQEAGVFQLNARQKKELAVLVKNKYHSSNKQLARVIKIPLSEVDAMFPLRAKR